MIEMLLVITVAAALIATGLSYYSVYSRGVQLHLVENDVMLIRQSLDRFYDSLPCDASGVLQNGVDTDLIAQLDLNPILISRPPYVDSYHAYIIDSGAMTAQNKPVYHLEVRAAIDTAYHALVPTLALHWLATSYNAESNIIYWDSLPHTSMTEPGSDLWVMSASRDNFRNLKNNATLATGVVSHAYCAR